MAQPARFLILLEYLPGKTLSQVLYGDMRLPTKYVAVKLMANIASALSYLHNLTVPLLHGDINR